MTEDRKQELERYGRSYGDLHFAAEPLPRGEELLRLLDSYRPDLLGAVGRGECSRGELQAIAAQLRDEERVASGEAA